MKIHRIFFWTQKCGFMGYLRSYFDKIIDQSNVNGFSWKFSLILQIKYPHFVGVLKGPPSPPQELEVGSHTPPYLPDITIPQNILTNLKNIISLLSLTRRKNSTICSKPLRWSSDFAWWMKSPWNLILCNRYNSF